MTEPEQTADAEIPRGLVEAVVDLVGTGPVPLGGYTLAECLPTRTVIGGPGSAANSASTAS